MSSRPRRLCPRGPDPRPRPAGCFRPDVPPRLPDPGIYSQAQRFAAGGELTFANPDIHRGIALSPGWDTNGPAAGAAEGPLQQLVHRVRVAVTNFSDDAPAAGVQVHVEGAPWGIAMPRTQLGAFSVDLGVASSANARRSHTIYLGVESTARTFFVRVAHPKDRDRANNVAIDAQWRRGVAAGAFTLPFPVHNPLQRPARIDLAVMTARWGALVSPASLELLPGQTGAAALAGHADPSGMAPSDRFEFTIVATIDGALLGGLTYQLGPASGR